MSLRAHNVISLKLDIYPELFGVFLNKDICVLFWCIYLACIILVRHEIVVNVIVISHSNCINALAQVVFGVSVIASL